MKCPSIPDDDSQRLKALCEYALDPGATLSSLSPVVRIASRMFDMPIAAVNMIGSDRVFFAASHGLGDGSVDMTRDASFCAHAILTENGMIVRDAERDERFHDNPLVTGPSHIRFYAGVPLRSPEGYALGALCILDNTPHQNFTAEDHARLTELARMASDRLELRRIEVASEHHADRDTAVLTGEAPVIHFDRALRITGWNAAASQLCGYAEDESAELVVSDLFGIDENTEFWSAIRRVIADGTCSETPPFEVGGRHKNGSKLFFVLSLFCECCGGNLQFTAALRDMTRYRQDKKAVAISADCDPLTGLRNRRRFYRCVEDAVLRDPNAAIMMIDIDGFSDVNAAFGHAAGDEILCEITHRLLTSTKETQIVARIGGDEFAVLLPDIYDQAEAGFYAQQIMAHIAQPILVQGSPISVTVSGGISLAPKHGYEALELIANADLALSRAKRTGRNQLYIFTPELRQEATARRHHAMELLRATDNSEFVLFYQPQIKLSDGSLSGAEALIRWVHPTRGLLPPSEFLTTLARGPMAVSVGSWILDEACSQAAYWRRCGAPDFRIGVNLFDVQLTTGDLAAEIADVLKRHGLPAEALEIELTENIALNNNNDSIMSDTLQKIRDMGVSIAFDDFGTGYASLSMLNQYPVTRIKIDRSFIQNLLTSRRDASVAYAILDIARNFEIEAIAEGIETAEQWHDLRQHGCQEGQGYWFGKPLEAQAFATQFGLVQQSFRKRVNP
ncbi:EAL domain-containing protein [Candidatus Symbiopectobacterium sp. NZEC127]|uniref:putative bifunctional diguanylate cyclase/phosphodiesterase n=1 Tax=Candidatus Symbiopectobacterium sp. NZEC127 TaxID=2820472 RepID=UPI0022270C81|nr:EAL domain-containing protein [Candidatus Symbiopectobacterium sp. NZEC127]MCW2485394.1 EAL domain-containing protein [Candidatus Symbiopectobacterium sp. NZEC127]